jgi:cardiolipin synthase
MQGYVRILLEARKYVFIETPYFLPTEPVLFAMRTAALAGVDVRLLVPMHPDTRLAKWASHSYMTETIKSGIKVYFYKPGFNHSKLLICDDSLCTCGSTNVDFRSFENNFESNIFFYDEQMALRMKQVFLDDLANSVLMNGQLRVDRRPFMVRLWESLIRLLAPLL